MATPLDAVIYVCVCVCGSNFFVIKEGLVIGKGFLATFFFNHSRLCKCGNFSFVGNTLEKLKSESVNISNWTHIYLKV